MKEVRIDKWLWATRVFKTRTIATTACKLGRVTIGGMTVKPSHGIKVGDRIDVRKPPVTYSFEVIALLNNRVGAKLVPQYLKNVTSADQLRLLEMVKIDGFVNRQRGMGRPTKKEGRELQEFTDDAFFGFDEPAVSVSMPQLDDAFDWEEEENPLWTQEDEDRLNEEISRQQQERKKDQ
ncbi:MAG: RNA-binding S4 domain-containing protein [Muribaculaceae bacterium]|nr:RNA-binding S4 domain-containing protein [Muribaculaceae bacterium]MBQ7205420.1 RNA-binding S4 domain-containing protein [Muribaculaceae bacterium]